MYGIDRIYEMELKKEPFEKMKSGNKTMELRLFDEKLRRIDIGDKIIFTNYEDPVQKIAVVVKSLHRYATFKDLFTDIPPQKCGNNLTETPESAASGMSQYYNCAQIQKYGVLGIGIEIADTEIVLKQLKEQKEAEFDRLFPDGMK